MAPFVRTGQMQERERRDVPYGTQELVMTSWNMEHESIVEHFSLVAESDICWHTFSMNFKSQNVIKQYFLDAISMVWEIF